MTLYFLVSLCLALAYLYLIGLYKRGWQQTPKADLAPDFQPHTPISILVAARNEAADIQSCIHSILRQNYPDALWELIVIDDYSTDNTAELVQSIDHQQLHLLQMEGLLREGGKKNAITAGVDHAKGELIVCTDADCLVPQGWLLRLATCYEKGQRQFIAAPVNFHREKSKFEQFQSLDLIGMMGITAACIELNLMHMCNGANLAYTKSAFLEVNGFEGIDRLASGDDMLLMQKIAQRFPGQTGFLKDAKATVLTSAMPDYRSFLQQRLRWASKSRHYTERTATLMLALVFFFCCNIILSVLLIPFFGWQMLGIALLQIGAKAIADYYFLRRMSAWFGRTELMSNFAWAQLLHILYIAIVGLLSNLITKYQWKGRTLR